MTPPRLTITTGSSSQGQPLREDLVAAFREQYPEKSSLQIYDMVSAWNDSVTLRQTTTTTTTNEVVIPKKTPTPSAKPPTLSQFTAAQIAASFAAFGRPQVQTATVPPLVEPSSRGRQPSRTFINEGMTATEEAAYQRAFPETPVATLTLPGHFEPKTPPSEIDSESDINITE